MSTGAKARGGAAILMAAGALLAGCGGRGQAGTKTAPPAQAAPAQSAPAQTARATPQVTIRNFTFTPATLTVRVGTSITVTNADTTEHTATAASGAFDTGTVRPGAAAHITLTAPGSYSYVCSFHPFMHGTINATR